MRDGYLRGSLSRAPTARQVDVLAAFVAAGGSVSEAAALLGIRPSTAKRHLADLRARSGLTTEQLIYRGRAGGWHSRRSGPGHYRRQAGGCHFVDLAIQRVGDEHVAGGRPLMLPRYAKQDTVNGVAAPVFELGRLVRSFHQRSWLEPVARRWAS